MKPLPSPRRDLQAKLRKRTQTLQQFEREQERVQRLKENDELSLQAQAVNDDRQLMAVSTVGSGIVRKIGRFLWHYFTDIFCRILNLLRIPISFAIAVFLFYTVGIHIQARLVTSVSFLPILCTIPLPSIASICQTNKPKHAPEISSPETVVDFPALTQLQVHAFNELLDDNTYTSRIGFELKKAEAATGDLAVIVQVSQLKGRVNLATSLVEFGIEAAKAGWSLVVLDGKINAAMDHIIAMNNYMLREIGRLSELASNSHSSVSLSFVEDSASHFGKLFDKAMSFMDSELRSLKSIAASTLKDQTSLEERLKTIHMLVAMEEVAINLEKDDLLSNLWGFLGSNRKELQQYNYNLALLQTISAHRKQAQFFVLNILQTLEETSVNLELLRGRITQSSSLEEDMTLPLEVHIQSLKAGIQRLTRNKLRTFEQGRKDPKEGPLISQHGEIPSLPESPM